MFDPVNLILKSSRDKTNSLPTYPAALGAILCLLILTVGPATAEVTPEVGFDVDVTRAADSNPSASGFIPPPFPTGHIAASVAASHRAEKALAASYDCRTVGLVSPVKDQGACGACYAFGSAADLESRLLAAGLPLADLSENSIKECLYQGSGCEGGNQYMTMSYLANQGAVLETCDPYEETNVACATGCGSQYTVLQWRAISGGSVPDTSVLKQYLHDYGPLHTTLFAGDATAPGWSADFNGFVDGQVLYFTGGQTPNHSVVLVGWDDDLVHTGGSGAWIVKNSWGTNWGGTCGYGTSRGYFAIAYGSASVGMYSSFVGSFMGSNGDAVLQKVDEAGFTAGFGAGSTTMWGMVRQVLSGDEYLHRVEFWTTDATTDVDVMIYDDFSGGSPTNLLDMSLNNSFAEPGYHFIELSSPLALSRDQDIYVVVKYTNLSYIYPLAVDTVGPVDSGSSWYSLNGSSWYDLGTQSADVTIRTRTSSDTVLANNDPGDEDPDVPPGHLPTGLTIDRAWPNPFNPRTTVQFSLAKTAVVSVAVYDMSGRLARILLDEPRAAGQHEATWNGRTDTGLLAPAGTYFCIVTTSTQARGVKLVLLK